MLEIDSTPRPITLTSQEVLRLTTETLKKHFNLLVKGHKYTDETIFHILTKASAKKGTIEEISNQLKKTPHPNGVRYQLKKHLLTNIQTLESHINEALWEHLLSRIRNKKLDIAIDLTSIPYHGKAYASEDEIRRGKAKSGTTHFHCYASAYVIKKNKRTTLALTYVQAQDTLIEVLERLFNYLAKIPIILRKFYLDKGFYQVNVIRFLKACNIPAIIPVVIRGRKGGIRKLLKGRQSYKTTYTMRSQRYGETSFEVFIVCKYSQGRYARHGLSRFAYAVLGNPNLSIFQVYEEYRLRFGIESSYRLMNDTRARTTSRNPSLRLLLVGIAFILLNIWVSLKWILGEPRRGGRYIHPKLFILSQLHLFLIEAIKEIYGVTLTVQQPLGRKVS